MPRNITILLIAGLCITTVLISTKAAEPTPSTSLRYYQVVVSFPPNSYMKSFVRWNPKNSQIAIGYQNSTDIDVLESLNGKLLATLIKPESNAFNSLHGPIQLLWSPNGKFLAARFEQDYHRIVIWNLETRLPSIILSISDIATTGFMVWSPDSKYLAADFGDDGPEFGCTKYDKPNDTTRHLEIWNVDTGKIARKFPPGLNDIIWSPDGKRILARTRCEGTELWIASTYKRIISIPRIEKDDYLLVQDLFSWSPDSNQLAEADSNFISGDCFLSIRETKTGNLVTSLTGDYSDFVIQSFAVASQW
jgi:WD40 repeat protein